MDRVFLNVIIYVYEPICSSIKLNQSRIGQYKISDDFVGFFLSNSFTLLNRRRIVARADLTETSLI